MASFQKYSTKEGTLWMYKIYTTIDPISGKKKQTTKRGFKTKKEAQLDAAALEQSLANGTYIKGSDITFKNFAKQWLDIYKSTGRVKASTVKLREVCINRIQKFFVDIKLKDISKHMYQNFLFFLHEKEYAKETILATHTTAKMIFSKAIELEVITSSPTQYSVIPTKQKTVQDIENNSDLPKYLEKGQLALFLSTCNSHGLDKDYVVFLTLAYTGMRIGELCALKWSDIDFEEKTISITKTYWNPTNNTITYIIGTPKTAASTRMVDVDQTLLDTLSKHKSALNVLRMRHRDVYHDENFVFPKMREFYGYPEKPKVIENRMKRILKIAKLNTNLTPHSLRHTHTSLLAEAKVELVQIMERLGHADDAITRNVYLHVTKTVKREASERFSQLMNNL